MSIPPLRVCVIITGLGMGGAEHALLQLLSRFDRARFDLRLLVLGNEDALAQRFEQIDVPPRWLDLHAGRWPVGGVRRLLQAVREIAVVHPTLQHVGLELAHCLQQTPHATYRPAPGMQMEPTR